jgi:hypothetical protein
MTWTWFFLHFHKTTKFGLLLSLLLFPFTLTDLDKLSERQGLAAIDDKYLSIKKRSAQLSGPRFGHGKWKAKERTRNSSEGVRPLFLQILGFFLEVNKNCSRNFISLNQNYQKYSSKTFKQYFFLKKSVICSWIWTLTISIVTIVP